MSETHAAAAAHVAADAAHGGHAAPKHPYHLVDPSPWPIVGALGGGLTVLGIILKVGKDYGLRAVRIPFEPFLSSWRSMPLRSPSISE